MSKALAYYSLFILLLLSYSSANAINFPKGKHGIYLKAEKGKHSKKYYAGTYLRVIYSAGKNDETIISGRLTNITEDSITLLVHKKRKEVKRIAIADIASVQKLHKKGRWFWKIQIFLLIASAILGIIFIDTYGALLFLAAPVVALYTYVPYLIGSFLADLISKKSVKKGWQFSTEEGKRK